MKTTYWYILLAVIVIGGIVGIKIFSDKSPASKVGSETPYDTFAQCLSDKGAKFYGAYWCPHCQAQKKLFNNSKKLPYIECSTPDGKGQTPICVNEKIEGYPTWIFADGSRESGELTFEKLAEKTQCSVPTSTPSN